MLDYPNSIGSGPFPDLQSGSSFEGRSGIFSSHFQYLKEDKHVSAQKSDALGHAII
jgi:hypothetical protein